MSKKNNNSNNKNSNNEKSSKAGTKKNNVKILVNEDVIRESKEYKENGGIEQKEEGKPARNKFFEPQKKAKNSGKPEEAIPEKKDEQKLENVKTKVATKAPETAEESKKEAEKEQGSSGKLVAKSNKDENLSAIDQEKTENNKEEKQDKRPVSISLKGKSEQFKKIIDVALAYEKMEEERDKIRKQAKALAAERAELKQSVEEKESLCKQNQAEIEKLKADVEHRNEVIGIVKADKTESSQEFKNALGASLKTFHTDFVELKGMEMSNDVGFAMSETLENVFKVLEKNGITIK